MSDSVDTSKPVLTAMQVVRVAKDKAQLGKYGPLIQSGAVGVLAICMLWMTNSNLTWQAAQQTFDQKIRTTEREEHKEALTIVRDEINKNRELYWAKIGPRMTAIEEEARQLRNTVRDMVDENRKLQLLLKQPTPK